MWTFVGDNLALILGFGASTLTGLFAYWQATRKDESTKDAFLFGSINKVVELLQSDNTSLRQKIVQLEDRITQLEARIVALIATAQAK